MILCSYLTFMCWDFNLMLILMIPGEPCWSESVEFWLDGRCTAVTDLSITRYTMFKGYIIFKQVINISLRITIASFLLSEKRTKNKANTTLFFCMPVWHYWLYTFGGWSFLYCIFITLDFYLVHCAHFRVPSSASWRHIKWSTHHKGAILHR